MKSFEVAEKLKTWTQDTCDQYCDNLPKGREVGKGKTNITIPQDFRMTQEELLSMVSDISSVSLYDNRQQLLSDCDQKHFSFNTPILKFMKNLFNRFIVWCMWMDA